MYFIKNCESAYNVKRSKSLKIGTLDGYKKTEILQIQDIEEGYLNVNFNIKNKLINTNLFNRLSQNYNSEMRLTLKEFSLNYQINNAVNVTISGKGFWQHRNRFIFCLSSLDSLDKAEGLFNNYDDFWYFDADHLYEFKHLLASALRREILFQLKIGNSIFTKSKINIAKLRIEPTIQKIIYRSREMNLDNTNINEKSIEIVQTFENIKFIKPAIYEHESEIRIVFEITEDGEPLIPVIGEIIVPYYNLRNILTK